MFREMRRNRQLLSLEECEAVLARRTAGVLAVAGDDGYPYAVPLSFVYEDSKFYFHCAQSGHKLDAIMRNEKASFCVIDCDDVVQQEFTTYYRSVIAFGKARVLSDESEKRIALDLLAKKYSPDDERERLQEIEKSLNRVCMVELMVEHMTGKEALELIRKNK